MAEQTVTDIWFSAIGRKSDYQTMVYYPGTGSDTFEFNFSGGYINREDIKAFMVEDTTRERVELTMTFINTNTVKTNRVVPVGWTICIYRDTPKSMPLAKFVDGAIINATNLDRNAKQAVFSVSEMVDRFDSTVESVEEALVKVAGAIADAKEAIETANAAAADAEEAVETANASTEVAAEANAKADTAVKTADAAKATAEGIDAKATKALEDAAAAVVTADEAAATANGIDAKATEALSTANAAAKDAATALSTANGIDGKATQAQKDAAKASTDAAEALKQVGAATGNFDKLWSAVDGVNEAKSVNWKGAQITNYLGIKNVDGVTTYALRDQNGSLQMDYNANSAKYFNMLGITTQSWRYRAVGGTVAVVTGDNAREMNYGFVNDASTVIYNYSGGVNRIDFNGLLLKTSSSFHTTGTANGRHAEQGAHFCWNESGDGKGSIVVNRGGGAGGFKFRFVDAGNQVQTGGVDIDGNGTVRATADIQSAGQVWAGNGGGRLAADGNVWGAIWGGWAGDWVKANCMSDMGRGGQQFVYTGDWIYAWEAPSGCFMTGLNSDGVNDGRKMGRYFRQLIGRKINGGQFGIGDFG